MNRVVVEGIELEYEERGAGEPVVLMHAGVFADWFKPLFDEPALNNHYRLISYHRAGYAGSSRISGSVSIAQNASHLRSLMGELEIARAHIVGHSSSGNMAIQLALDAPDVVGSLAILEPDLLNVPSAQTTRAFVGTALQLHRAGDRVGAVDTFLEGTCGSGYRALLDTLLPDAFDHAVKDSDTFFGQELPALQQWSFNKEDALSITQPVLAVIGEKSLELSPIWAERQELLLNWLPNAEPFVLPDATHLLHAEYPHEMAEALATFFARHPLLEML
jgi:pimeloyl-ACP methyl ester carboxylesterase